MKVALIVSSSGLWASLDLKAEVVVDRRSSAADLKGLGSGNRSIWVVPTVWWQLWSECSETPSSIPLAWSSLTLTGTGRILLWLGLDLGWLHTGENLEFIGTLLELICEELIKLCAKQFFCIFFPVGTKKRGEKLRFCRI